MHADIKSICLSVLPMVVYIDGVKQSGTKIRKTESRGLQRSKVDDKGTIYMTRTNHSDGEVKDKTSYTQIESHNGAVPTESFRRMQAESKKVRERSAQEKRARDIKLATRKPESRKVQLEMDRRRTRKLILKQEMFEEMQKEREEAFAEDQRKRQKVITSDASKALVNRLTSTTRRDASFHQTFLQTKAGARAYSPPRHGRDYLHVRGKPGQSVMGPTGNLGQGHTMSKQDYQDEITVQKEAGIACKQWMAQCIVELGRSAAVIAMLFSVTKNKGDADIKSLDAFKRGVKKIPFHYNVALPEHIESALGHLPARHPVLTEIAEVIEKMALVSDLVLQLEEMCDAMQRDSRIVASNGHIDVSEFKRQLDELMDSPSGQHVNDKLLIAQGCGYWYSSTSKYFQEKAAAAEMGSNKGGSSSSSVSSNGSASVSTGVPSWANKTSSSPEKKARAPPPAPKPAPVMEEDPYYKNAMSRGVSNLADKHKGHGKHQTTGVKAFNSAPSAHTTHDNTNDDDTVVSSVSAAESRASAVDSVKGRLAARALKLMGDSGRASPLSVSSSTGAGKSKDVPVVALNLSSPLAALNQSRTSIPTLSPSPVVQLAKESDLYEEGAASEDNPDLLDSEKLAEATKELSADVEKLLVPEESSSGSPTAAAAAAAADISVIEPTGEAAVSNEEPAVNPNEVSLAHAYEDAGVVQSAPATAVVKEEENELPSWGGGAIDSDGFAPSPAKPKAVDATTSSAGDDPFASFAPSPTRGAAADGFAPTTGSGAAYDPFAPSPVKNDGFAATPAAFAATTDSDGFFASSGAPAAAPATQSFESVPVVGTAAGAAPNGAADGEDKSSAKERIRARIEAMKKKKEETA
jgi:hypothetical protein